LPLYYILAGHLANQSSMKHSLAGHLANQSSTKHSLAGHLANQSNANNTDIFNETSKLKAKTQI
jgi:hypothetical protein